LTCLFQVIFRQIQTALDRAHDQGLQLKQVARVSSTLRLISDGRFQMADFQL
jgi:hypothetical protein